MSRLNSIAPKLEELSDKNQIKVRSLDDILIAANINYPLPNNLTMIRTKLKSRALKRCDFLKKIVILTQFSA